MGKKRISNVVFYTFFALTIVLWLAVVLIKAATAEGAQIVQTEEDYFSCAEGWYDDDGNTVNLEDYVFEEEDINKEKVFYYRIPEEVEIKGDEALCFFSRGMNFRMYCKTQVGTKYDLFQYDQNAAGLSGTDVGLSLHVVSLKQADKQNKIAIAITPTEFSAFIMNLRIENEQEFVMSTVRSRTPMFLASVFIVFFGFAIIIYTLFAVETKRERKYALYAWGALTLTTGLVLVIQTQMIQILTGQPELWTAMKYALCLVMGYFSSLLVDYVTQTPHRRYSRAIGYFTAVLMLTETVGTMLGVLSFYRLWYLSAIIGAFNFGIAIVFFIKDVQYRKKKRSKKGRFALFMLASVPVMNVILGVDLAIYAKAKRHMTDWGRLTRIYYIIYIVIILIILLQRSIVLQSKARMMEKYKRESTTDALTGLLNKGAYITKEEELSEKLFDEDEEDFIFAIVSLDLNFLKKVNDNYGHEAGDHFIKAAADTLSAAVGDRGECYRVGGDEFLAILYGDDPETTYQAMVEDLLKKLDEFNEAEQREIPLCFAYGHAICKTGQEYSIHDAERLADKEMYECKHRMKAERE